MHDEQRLVLRQVFNVLKSKAERHFVLLRPDWTEEKELVATKDVLYVHIPSLSFRIARRVDALCYMLIEDFSCRMQRQDKTAVRRVGHNASDIHSRPGGMR